LTVLSWSSATFSSPSKMAAMASKDGCRKVSTMKK
jgi:hypothetical protein